jgi:hypothetical protein
VAAPFEAFAKWGNHVLGHRKFVIGNITHHLYFLNEIETLSEVDMTGETIGGSGEDNTNLNASNPSLDKGSMDHGKLSNFQSPMKEYEIAQPIDSALKEKSELIAEEALDPEVAKLVVELPGLDDMEKFSEWLDGKLEDIVDDNQGYLSSFHFSSSIESICRAIALRLGLQYVKPKIEIREENSYEGTNGDEGTSENSIVFMGCQIAEYTVLDDGYGASLVDTDKTAMKTALEKYIASLGH